MPALPPTQFSRWTQFGYASFYKRYRDGLEAVARGRFRCTPEEAEELAHGFLAEQSLSPGGVLARYQQGRRFRSYVVAAFCNHCRRRLQSQAPAPLPEELVAPDDDDPAARLLEAEAEALRLQVREAVEEARQALLARGALRPPERAYLQLKWPAPERPPLSDLEVGQRLAARGLLSGSEATLTRASARLGASVGRLLVARLHALLLEAWRAHVPEADAAREARLSLGAIVHVLDLEEAGAQA